MDFTRFLFFYCAAHKPGLTLMFSHVLPQFSPGVFHDLAISLRAVVTCEVKTRAEEVCVGGGQNQSTL